MAIRPLWKPAAPASAMSAAPSPPASQALLDVAVSRRASGGNATCAASLLDATGAFSNAARCASSLGHLRIGLCSATAHKHSSSSDRTRMHMLAREWPGDGADSSKPGLPKRTASL
eukprot:scaffold8481_cov286-Pinguiococcus_pyrenoidosus.AAC.6